jgi:transitional endoplasmic reticulum ATPase
MNARDQSCAVISLVPDTADYDFSHVWKSDFSAIEPQSRRAARYVLQLLTNTLEPDGDEEELGSVDAGWKLITPLINEAAANNSYDTTVNAEDNPRMRWLKWRALILTHLPAGLIDRLSFADGDKPTQPCVDLLVEILSLNVTETRLLDYLEKCVSVEGFSEFLGRLKSVQNWHNRQRLACMLKLTEADIRLALKGASTLLETRLIEVSRRHTRDLDDFIEITTGFSEILFASPTTAVELSDMLIESAPQSNWELADFPHHQANIQRLLPTIRRAANEGVRGINSLLYGLPGTGKTEFACALAKAAGLTMYMVRSGDDEGDGLDREGRLTAYLIAQRMLKHRRDVVILFDEIEDVFADDDGALMRMLMGAQQSGGKEKGWMNRLLEENPVPAIWVTNNTSVMDAAFLRRFLLPAEFTIPPRSIRQKMIECHLGDCALPDHLLDALAADDKLTPAVFGNARKLLDLHGINGDEAANSQIVVQGVASIRRLLHGSGLPLARQSATTFDVAFLNIAGGIAPSSIVSALERQGRGSMCFYGPPGTGKTEFAHAIADALDRELVVKRASDLVSKYVGETEQNIARLFNTIDAERSVLFVDEIDSFLRDRREAKHSWEISAVNEFLQHMEIFPGIFIAATNLVEGIDAAALRRFDFKLAFKPLSLPQRAAMFAKEGFGDVNVATTLPPAIVNRLAQLDLLTAGDFANVCRQRDLLGEMLAPEEFLKRLAQECRWKVAS